MNKRLTTSYTVFYAVDADAEGRAGCLDYLNREPRGITYVKVAEDQPTPAERTHCTNPQPSTCGASIRHVLEEIFTRWNRLSTRDEFNPPENLRSLSVGDIVVVDGGAYICARFGWALIARERHDSVGRVKDLFEGHPYTAFGINRVRGWLELGQLDNTAPDAQKLNTEVK